MSVTQSGFPRTISTAIVPGGPIGNFRVPGIQAGDTLLAVNSVTSGLVPTNQLANASIPAGTSDTVAIATVNTTGSWLLVTWAAAN
jgi:hypothetical protein